MSSISYARNFYVDIKANRIQLDAPLVSVPNFRKFIQLFPIALIAASLAACAQSSVVTNKSELLTARRQTSLEDNQKASFVTNRRAAVTKIHTLAATNKHAAATQVASYGLASFYTDAKTASGEKFDPYKLTAAHRTLPFGTRLRVTNIATGRFVTVRINDRGPFVPGRVVDVSYTAAETLGITEQGIAKVKLDVVK